MIEKKKFVVLVSRIDPINIAGMQNLLESFNAWKGGGYAFISPDEANAMVERDELHQKIKTWMPEPIYQPYETWSFICRTEYAAREGGFGYATVTQRMTEMIEAYQVCSLRWKRALAKATGVELVPKRKPKFAKKVAR